MNVDYYRFFSRLTPEILIFRFVKKIQLEVLIILVLETQYRKILEIIYH